MSADVPGNTTTAPSDPNPAPGLPPVVPPSGRHIVQMFLVPGFIVIAVVGVLLFFTWLQSGHNDASSIIGNLDADNAEVRWRAANDLTQRLKRDENLATDPNLGTRLAVLLKKRLGEYEELVKRYKSDNSALSADDQKSLRERRKDVQFLVSCVGNLMLPIGSELLCEVLKHHQIDDEVERALSKADWSEGQHPKFPEIIAGRILLRRDAVWALSNLGNNLERLRDLPSERRNKIFQSLRDEAGWEGDREHFARPALNYVVALDLGQQPPSNGVIKALAEAADENGEYSDIFLRELIAHALNFWHGDENEEKIIDGKGGILNKLAHDQGNGKDIRIEDND